MGSKKSTTTSRVDLPDWLTSAGEQATDMGMRIASREPTQYMGRRFANLSNNEQRAVNLAAEGNGKAQQFIDMGTNMLATAKGWDQATDAERKAYEEPIFQAVTRPAIDQVNKSYTATTQNLRDKQGILSAHGQDQFNLRKMATDRNYQQTTDDITAQGRYQAHTMAQQQWGADQQRKMAVADALRMSGGDLSRLNAQQIQDLLMTGGAERVLEQAGLDFEYGKFLEARDWDVNNLGPLLAAVRGASGHHDTTAYNVDKEKGDPIGQLVGLGATLAGSYYNWGGSNLRGATQAVNYQPTSPIGNVYDPNLWSQPQQARV